MIRKVQVWIYGRDQQDQLHVLLLKTNPQRGSFWQPVTGGVERDETLLEAASREAREETGLTFAQQPETVDYRFRFKNSRSGDQEIEESVFALEIVLAQGGLPVVKIDPLEHVEAAWVRPEQALGLLAFKSNQEALKVLLEKKDN